MFDITGLLEPATFYHCCVGFCSTGHCLISSFERVCYARVHPGPSAADRCRGDDPKHSGNPHCASDHFGNSRGSDCGEDPGTNCGDHKRWVHRTVCNSAPVEQIGDVPVPQIQERTEEVVAVIPQEHFSWCASSEVLSQTRVSLRLVSKYPINCFLDNTRVLTSAGMTFLAGQSLGGCSSEFGVNGWFTLPTFWINLGRRSMTATFGL